MVSTYYYLTIAAVMETIMLWIRGGNEWVLALTNEDWSIMFMNSHLTVCKVYPTFASFFLQFSVWLITCVAIEGALIAKDPRAIMTVCTVKRAKAVISVLIVVLFCPNVHFFWTYELVPYNKMDPSTAYCTVAKYGKGHDVTEEFVTLVWPVINILVTQIVPYVIILVCMITIATHPIKKVTKMNGSTVRNQSLIVTKLVESHRVKLGICLMYLILALPHLVNTMYKSLKNFLQSAQPDASPNELEPPPSEHQETLANTLTLLLFQIFQATQLFLCLVLSEEFRYETKRVLTCCYRQWKIKQRRKQSELDRVRCIPSTSSDNTCHYVHVHDLTS